MGLDRGNDECVAGKQELLADMVFHLDISEGRSSTNPGVGLLASDDWDLVAYQLRLAARELSVAMLMFEGKSRYQIARVS